MPVRTFFEKAKLYGMTPKRKRYDQGRPPDQR